MGAKIAAFLISTAIYLMMAAAGGFFLLIALNGYSESDATYGLVTYGILSIVVAIVLGVGATVFAHIMMGRGFRAVSSVLTAIAAAIVLGIIAVIVCGGIGIGVAEYARNNL